MEIIGLSPRLTVQRVEKLRPVVRGINRKLLSEDLGLDVARLLAYHHGEFITPEDISEVALVFLKDHYGLISRKYSVPDQMNDFNALVAMEEKYGVDGRLAAQEFNGFSSSCIVPKQYELRVPIIDSRFGNFAQICYGATIIKHSEERTHASKPSSAPGLFRKGIQLIGEIVTGINSPSSQDFLQGEDSLRTVLKLEKRHLKAIDMLVNNTRIAPLKSYGELRLNQILTRRGVRV